MAGRPLQGPKATRRIRARAAAVSGHGLTRKFPDGTVITFDTDPLMVVIADALIDFMIKVGEQASDKAPDYPTHRDESGHMVSDPYPGYGLPTNWGVMGWTFGKLIYGQKASRTDERINKPRAFRTDPTSVEAIVGFGFPGRFVETGTSDTPAEPFLGPTGVALAGGGLLQHALRSRLTAAGDR